MILPSDEESIQRMLGVTEIPATIEPEYDVWLRMRHRDGATGPLGSDLCLCLLRKLGIDPPAYVEPEGGTDWRKVAVGARVIVEMSVGTHLGVYRGKIDVGTIGVLLDGEKYVREINKRHVKLHDETPDLNVDPDDPHSESPVIDLDETATVDWTQYKRGDKVWVETSDDVLDGTFWQAKDGKVTVKVGADKVAYEAGQVVPVER